MVASVMACLLACSPHVHTLRERISVSGDPISEADFDDLVRQHEQTLLQCREQEASALSHFEVTTALAFKHFQQKQACCSPDLQQPIYKSHLAPCQQGS